MAGHSQFKNIMHRKGRQDAVRSKLFGKLSREITVAAKMGLPDPDMNARLRAAIAAAKAESVPKDNIDRAIKKATGNDAEIDVDNINSNLDAGRNVVVLVGSGAAAPQQGTITVESNVDIVRSGPTTNTVTLHLNANGADDGIHEGDIFLEADADIISTSGALNVILNADVTNSTFFVSVETDNSKIRTNGGSFTARAEDFVEFFNATEIETLGGDVLVDALGADAFGGDYSQHAAATINTTGITDGNVTFNGTLRADDAAAVDRTLNITAGSADVTFNGSVGTGTGGALADLDVSADEIDFNGTDMIVNDGPGGNTVSLNAAFDLGANLSINTDGAAGDNNLSFTGDINGANALSIDAGSAEHVRDGGIGLRNVNERLRVIYGANYQLQLDSVPGEGTCARIVIPELVVPARIPA